MARVGREGRRDLSGPRSQSGSNAPDASRRDQADRDRRVRQDRAEAVREPLRQTLSTEVSVMPQRRVAIVVMAASLATAAAVQQQPPPPPPKESIVTKLLRIAGLTVAPTQMRGPGDEVAPGDIWIA